MHRVYKGKNRMWAAGAALAAMSVFLPLPAKAQYFNNWSVLPYALGNSLAWPLRNILYLPYQVTNPYLYTNTGATLLYRATNNGQLGKLPFQNQYSNMYDPVTGAVNPSGTGTQPLQPGADPNDLTPAIDPATGRMLPPPLAPQRVAANAPAAQQPSTPANLGSGAIAAAAPNVVPQSTSGAPLVAGFIQRVNSKHDGDISKALFDPETRGWAKVVGLVQNNDQVFTADLSEQRVETVRQILKDDTLDPMSKLEAVKIMLRNTTPAVKR